MVALVTTSLVLTCVPSVAWAGTRAAICLAEGQPAPLPPAASDRSAMRWLAARSRPTDVVYRRAPAVAAYSYWAALPTTGIDVSVDGFPLAAEEIESLRQISVGPSEPEQLLRGGVRFLVVEPAREPDLVDRVEGWSAAGLTVEQTRFGELVVFEMLPRGRTRPETVP
jgi:hypothetical protein